MTSFKLRACLADYNYKEELMYVEADSYNNYYRKAPSMKIGPF